MGYVTCGKHGCRCCWRCDRCPKCEPETGKIGRGDYCQDCVAKFKAEGFVWSKYFQNYVSPEDASMNKQFGWETTDEWEKRVRALESQGLTRSDAQAVVDAEDARVRE